MTRAIAFAPIARAARRADAAPCVLTGAMSQATARSMRVLHAVTAVARSPGQGRS